MIMICMLDRLVMMGISKPTMAVKGTGAKLVLQDEMVNRTQPLRC